MKLANRVGRGDFRIRAQHRMHQEANCSHGGSAVSALFTAASLAPGIVPPPHRALLQAGTTCTVHLTYSKYLISTCRIRE